MSAPEQVPCPIDHNHQAFRFGWPARDAEQPMTLPPHACGAYFYNCPQCRPFALAIRDADALELPPENAGEEVKQIRATLLENKFKLKALLWEHASQKLPVPLLQLHDGPYWPIVADRPVAAIAIDEFLTRWPDSVPATLDRVLLNLGRGTPLSGVLCRLDGRSNRRGEWLSICFAESHIDAEYYLDNLAERKLIRDAPEGEGAVVTPAGWARIEELESARTSPRNPAFVAMWFGHDDEAETRSFMRDLYEHHMRPAIERAGYKADRVDLVPHNDFIMDKLMGMIRVAPFVVADFTGYRGGVYFEAGFARGRDIPVVHSCRTSHFKKAHFDIQQVNTITWDEPVELGERLYHRIMGTLGPGPFEPTKPEELASS